VIEGTKDAETGHLFIFLTITAITVWALASGWWDAAGWLLLFNLLHNGYPVLSMRQLRARLNAVARVVTVRGPVEFVEDRRAQGLLPSPPAVYNQRQPHHP
jgi:hypothetical protein